LTIYENISRLTTYALNNCLITEDDIIYTQNRLLELFRLDDMGETFVPVPFGPKEVKTEDLRTF